MEIERKFADLFWGGKKNMKFCW